MKQDLQYFCTKMLKEHQVKNVVVGGYSMRPSCHEMPWVIVSFPESFQKGFLIFLIVFCFFGRDNWTMQSTFNAYSILASSVCPGIFLNKGNGSICIHHQNGQAAHELLMLNHLEECELAQAKSLPGAIGWQSGQLSQCGACAVLLL